MGDWLAQTDVMAALHVKANTGGMTYRRTAGDLRPLYKTLIAKYRMLIYSGDVRVLRGVLMMCCDLVFV